MKIDVTISDLSSIKINDVSRIKLTATHVLIILCGKSNMKLIWHSYLTRCVFSVLWADDLVFMYSNIFFLKKAILGDDGGKLSKRSCEKLFIQSYTVQTCAPSAPGGYHLDWGILGYDHHVTRKPEKKKSERETRLGGVILQIFLGLCDT